MEEGFDLAIHPTPPIGSSLIVRKLSLHQTTICAAPAYLAAHGTPKHPSDLANHNCLLLSPSSWDREWPYRDREGEHRIAVSGNFRSNSAEALRLAALRGQGVLMTPCILVADDIASGALVPVVADYMPDDIAILAIYPHRHQLPAKVRSFIDLLANLLRTKVACVARSARQAA